MAQGLCSEKLLRDVDLLHYVAINKWSLSLFLWQVTNSVEFSLPSIREAGDCKKGKGIVVRRVEIKVVEELRLPLYEGDCIALTDCPECPAEEISFTSRTVLVSEYICQVVREKKI